jgi:hypothetical protein
VLLLFQLDPSPCLLLAPPLLPIHILGLNLVPSSCLRLMDGFCEDPFVVVDGCFGVLTFMFQPFGISVRWIGLDWIGLFYSLQNNNNKEQTL